MKNYKILQAYVPSSLEKQVNRYLGIGYHLIGRPFYASTSDGQMFFQTVIQSDIRDLQT